MNVPAGSLADLMARFQSKGMGALALVIAEDNTEFEAAFDQWLEYAVIGLETNKKDFKSMGEDGLSGALTLALNSPPWIKATRETNSNGHVDITIEVGLSAPMRRKLGEAKIYDSPAYHLKGLKQLLDRYTTGREGRGFVIAYFRKPNIAGLMKNLREEMDQSLPHDQKGPSKDHLLKWSFLSVHGHSCGEDLEVGHIGCNLYSGGAEN